MNNDYQEFKKMFKQKTGLDLSLYKEGQMKRRLEALMRKHGFHTFVEYFIGINKNQELFNELMDRITINVTQFYRDPTRWNQLEKEVIPELLKSKRKLKIWSSACSTGEEPYTLAMVMSNYLPLSQISILATDIDSKVMDKAKKGVYSQNSIVNVPEDMKRKFFVQEGNDWLVKDELKKAVTFKSLNLLKDPYPRNCDIILCRNVLIYFTEEAKDLTYTKFGAALADKGVLFVGSTEQIYTPVKYQLDKGKTFFYQKSS